jgi:hypothetical protein
MKENGLLTQYPIRLGRIEPRQFLELGQGDLVFGSRGIDQTLRARDADDVWAIREIADVALQHPNSVGVFPQRAVVGGEVLEVFQSKEQIGGKPIAHAVVRIKLEEAVEGRPAGARGYFFDSK